MNSRKKNIAPFSVKIVKFIGDEEEDNSYSSEKVSEDSLGLPPVQEVSMEIEYSSEEENSERLNSSEMNEGIPNQAL